MSKQLTLTLDEATYQRLLALCQGDEKALAKKAEELIAKQLGAGGAPLDASGLEDYLKQAPSGSRAYGVKGQGW